MNILFLFLLSMANTYSLCEQNNVWGVLDAVKVG